MIAIFNHIAEQYDRATVSQHLELVSLSLTDVREREPKGGGEPKYGVNDLARAGVVYLTGDARDLRRILQRHEQMPFDVITSWRALEYISRRRITQEVVKHVYRLLKPDGVANLGYADLLSYHLIAATQQQHMFTTILTGLNQDIKKPGAHIKIVAPRWEQDRPITDVVMHKTAAPFYIPLRY